MEFSAPRETRSYSDSIVLASPFLSTCAQIRSRLEPARDHSFALFRVLDEPPHQGERRFAGSGQT